MAASITVAEFIEAPDAQGQLALPANVVTRTTTASTVTLGANTRAVIITSDIDCRMSPDSSAATSSDIPILAAVPNQFKVTPASALKFTG